MLMKATAPSACPRMNTHGLDLSSAASWSPASCSSVWMSLYRHPAEPGLEPPHWSWPAVSIWAGEQMSTIASHKAGWFVMQYYCSSYWYGTGSHAKCRLGLQRWIRCCLYSQKFTVQWRWGIFFFLNKFLFLKFISKSKRQMQICSMFLLRAVLD